jgi:hypothetical protein
MSAMISGSAAFPGIAKILRTVPDANAFYFYKMLHYYLDVRARNLDEFLEQLKTIDATSLAFHVHRGDFANWFLTTLGAATLARSISTLARDSTNLASETLREKLASTVQMRLARLRRFA